MSHRLTHHLRRSPAALLLTLAAFALAAGAARAEAPAKANDPAKDNPPACEKVFDVPEGTLTLAWREKSERRIEVVSQDGKEHKLRARLGDLAMTDAEGRRLMPADFIKVEPEAALLSKDGGVQLLVSVERTTPVRPGVYVGSLTLSEEGAGARGCTVRRGVQVTVADTGPLADKLVLHAYRLVPFIDSLWTCPGCAVPLKSPLEIKTTALRNDVPLGGVQNKDGGTAAVYWTGGPSVSSEGLTLMPISLRGLDGAGQYDGRLRLGPAADEASSVTLTLDASDIVVWPIVVIAVSTWLGLRAQRYLNVMRTVWRLREQEAALGVAFDAARRRFDDAAGNSTFASYSIAEDVAARRAALRRKIDELQSGTTLTLDTSGAPYQAVLDDFKTIREAVAAWPGFADELAALRDELDRLDAGPPPQGYADEAPALLLAAGSPLLGRRLTLGELAVREKEVRETTAAVRLWAALRQRVEEGRSRAALLRGAAADMSAEQLAQLDTAERGLNTVELGLWEAATPAELNELTADAGTLDSAEVTLRELAANVGVPPPPPGAHPASFAASHASLGSLRGAFAREPASSREPADDRERQRFYADALRRWDVALACLSFVIATLMALNTNYFGKSFGTLRDYVGLVILGLGTKVAVDTASAAFGWLFGGAPSRKPGAGV